MSLSVAADIVYCFTTSSVSPPFICFVVSYFHHNNENRLLSVVGMAGWLVGSGFAWNGSIFKTIFLFLYIHPFPFHSRSIPLSLPAVVGHFVVLSLYSSRQHNNNHMVSIRIGLCGSVELHLSMVDRGILIEI